MNCSTNFRAQGSSHHDVFFLVLTNWRTPAALAAGSSHQASGLQQLEDALSEIGRQYIILNNTARSTSAEIAVQRAREGYAMTGSKYIKLEVFESKQIERKETLVPVNDEVYNATVELMRHPDDLHIIPYINRDIELAIELQETGVAGLRIYGSYIGLKQGLGDEDDIVRIIRRIHIPVIIEGGIGEPIHAQRAMELGADAVLVNTAITTADKPGEYAREFKEAVEQGRKKYVKNER